MIDVYLVAFNLNYDNTQLHQCFVYELICVVYISRQRLMPVICFVLGGFSPGISASIVGAGENMYRNRRICD